MLKKQKIQANIITMIFNKNKLDEKIQNRSMEKRNKEETVCLNIFRKSILKKK